MKHEIFVQLNDATDFDLLLARLKVISKDKFYISKIANSSVVSKLIHLHKSTLDRNQINTLMNGYKIHIDSNTKESIIKNIISQISSLPITLKVRYNGILKVVAENYDFPSLNNKPENNSKFFALQHLFMSPFGLDAMYGWTLEGGSGEGINVFVSDKEVGTDDEVDFTQIGKMGSGLHGLMVMGIIAAKNNNKSCIGIVPDANLYLSGAGNYDGVFEYGKPGDVVNLSIAYNASGHLEYPWSVFEENRILIQLAADMGITTCFSAGNYGENLDEIPYDGKFIFNKNHPDYIDSKGICVGGFANSISFLKTRTYNYGSFVDSFAQSNFVTTIKGIESGTSFSSPMIAGVIAQIQSIYKKHYGNPLPVSEIINVLRNPEMGLVLKAKSEFDKAVMPDLRKVLAHFNIFSKNIYPGNYGVSNEKLDEYSCYAESLFSDSSHTALAQGITLVDIYEAIKKLGALQYCELKSESDKLIQEALNIYFTSLVDNILDSNDFIDNPKSWLINAGESMVTNDGMVLSDASSGVLGIGYLDPIYINSVAQDIIIKTRFEVLEWDDSGIKEAVLGYYMPTIDLSVGAPNQKFQLTQDDNTLELLISDSVILVPQFLPSLGVRGAKKILLKEISIKKLIK